MKVVNCVLILILLTLIVNLFFPLSSIFLRINSENLGCYINDNFVNDAPLCCGEMSKFLSCPDGKCVSTHYTITVDENMLKYCIREGYNVRI